MNKKLKLGIDIDDVVADFISAFRVEAEQVLGRYFPQPPGSWSFKNWNISRGDVEKVWTSIRETPDWFYEAVPAFKDSEKCLKALAAKHELYFITARIPTAGDSIQRQTQRTLEDLGLICPTVLVVREKGKLVDALKLDAFVDDKVENLQDILIETMGKTKLFLFNQSHNEDYKGREPFIRVKSLKEFSERLDEIG